MILRVSLLLLFLTLIGWGQPTRYILHNGTIHTAKQDAFRGYVVVSNGQIEQVGQGEPPPGDLVDLQGGHLYPGLVDVDSAIGLVEIESLRATRDHSEVGKLNPNLEARYAFRAESDLVSVARSQGILTTGVNPSGGIISGQGSVMRLWGWTWEDMTIIPAWAMSLDWPRVSVSYSQKKKKKALKSIGKNLFFLSDAFDEAKSYQSTELQDVKWQALQPYARGERPVLIRVESPAEVRSALSWTEKAGVRPVLVAGRRIDEFAKELASRKIPVVYRSLFNQNPSRVENYTRHYRTPKILTDSGVLVALSSSGLAFDARELRDLAGRARAFGLTDLEALQTITTNPARILGVDDRLGSIESGKEATLILCDGDILEVAPVVTRAWGRGKSLDLSDRQKQLYTKYREHLIR